MLKESLIYIAWIAVAFLAIFLRTNQLDDRPMHADEATGARILSKQLEGEEYSFNPKHFHGPMLTQLTLPIARLRGENAWSELSSQTLRSSSAIAGILLIFTPLLWLRVIGKWGAWGAAALLATSPLLVYFSRMYIHESWLALFGMLACAGIYQLTLKPTRIRTVAAGLCVGLMFATKETFVISILSWSPAVILLLLLKKYSPQQYSPRPSSSDYLRALIIAAMVAIGCAGLFYSNYFRNPAQFMDAFRTFFEYETTIGHDKAFSYYSQLLILPKHDAGVLWTEGVVAILAAASALICIRKKSDLQFCLFLSISLILHILIYSSISYKTPWLMLLPWAHICILAGYVCKVIAKQPKLPRLAFCGLFALGLGFQVNQSLLANDRLANSSSNPYAYVPTSTDCPKIQHWLGELDTMHPLGTIAVVGHEYWPLPWYLRNVSTAIGYWPTPEAEMQTFPVVFAMPTQQMATRELLQSTHTELPRALRANVPVILHLRNDVWEQWQATPQK